MSPVKSIKRKKNSREHVSKVILSSTEPLSSTVSFSKINLFFKESYEYLLLNLLLW